MSIKETNTNQIVSVDQLSNEAKAQIKSTVLALNDSMLRISAEQELIKTALDDLNEELGIDKRLVRKMAKVYFKNNYNAEKDASATFEEFYDEVLK